MPDFFIIGAPKCGTTALYTYLSEHPQIFMPETKEPHFFASDFPDYRVISARKDYLELFASAPNGTLSGEASVWYLYSAVAIGNILQENRDAKFIVMLRNPTDMAHALHAQGLHSLDEDVPDFEAAWALQDERALGCSLPRHCRDPKLLQYRATASFAPQLERLYAQVPRDQVLILLFEEFVSDPGSAYAETLRFLEVAHDARDVFPKVNENRVRRSRLLAESVRELASLLGPQYSSLKRLLNTLGVRPGRALEVWNNRTRGRPPLSPSFRAQLARGFSSDIERLELLLDRPLDLWRSDWGDAVRHAKAS